MLKAIAAALASLWRGTLGVLRWTEQLVRWPFSLVFGSGAGGMPNSDYKPDVSASQILDEFEEARARRAAVHDQDRDGVSSVIKYAKAPAHARTTIDLGGLKADVRATLLTMDDNELRALAQAGLGAVRKFVEARDHGIHGVPVIKPRASAAELAPKQVTAEERMLWKVRSRMLKSEQSRVFRMSV
ncbi:hypothetical protein [Sinorhizobium chiapasense]|uniref:Uncharacterized protein n=1 Tax=Sinorhizobium chiapasense TaxID=501572 RepID=A0ABZ2B9T4_9HYPH